MRWKTPVLSMAAAVLVGSLAAAKPAAPHPHGPACPAQTFCAGAAGADITPPVTTPMWGYTARQGVMYSGTDVADDLTRGVTALGSADVAGFVAGLQSAADEQFVHDKTDLDTEGYGKTFVSNHGIELRLFANAFVLQDAHGVKEAIVQTDLGGLPGEVHQGVADRLAADGFDIDRDHLMIAATHTHQGPGGIFQYQGYALLGGDEFDPRVFDAVVGGITRAVERADANLTPAVMSWGQTTITNANRNRRVSPQWCEDPENACDANGHPTAASPPSNDPLLTMIRLDTAPGSHVGAGVPIGVITNFAAHGTIGGDHNLLFSGDNQGWATRLVDDAITGAYGHPLPKGWRVVDALINGAQGDQSPVGDAGPVAFPEGGSQYASMEDAGHRQMAPAIQLWRTLGSSLRSDVTLDSRFEFLCFCGQEPAHPYNGPKIDKTDPLWAHVSPYSSLGDGGVVLDDGMSSPVALPAQGHKFPALAAIGTNPSIARLQVMRIGDLLIAGFPGEPTVTVGRRAKAALHALDPTQHLYRDVIIAGLANEYDSYFATPEEYSANQYEGSFTLFGPQEAPLLIDELADLTHRMIAGIAVPSCGIPISDVAFCATHLPQPDTSGLALAPIPLTPDPAPRIVTQPASSARWFTSVQLVWDGGSPSAEWRPDQDRVEIERLVSPGHWSVVAGDAHDTWTLLRYDKVGGRHQWIAAWDIGRDVAAGTYRIRVLGATGGLAGSRHPYSLTSSPVVVSTPPVSLTVSIGSPGPNQADVRAFYPGDGLLGYRSRVVCDGTVTLTVDRGGSNVTLASPVDPSGTTVFALQPGDHVVSAHVVDASGNAG